MLKGLHYTLVFMLRMDSLISWVVVGREELKNEAVPRRRHLAEAKCTEEACLRRGHSPKVNLKGAQACARRGGSMDFLMESGFMQWMSERMSFTNWVKADFHETSRITLKFSAPPREISARRGEFALRQLLFLG